jgi:hypothetical protein
MILSAHQQWELAKLWARQARTLPTPRCDRMLKRAYAMAFMAQLQWQHPDHPRTAKAPCSLAMMCEMGFPPAWIAALHPTDDRPQT